VALVCASSPELGCAVQKAAPRKLPKGGLNDDDEAVVCQHRANRLAWKPTLRGPIGHRGLEHSRWVRNPAMTTIKTTGDYLTPTVSSKLPEVGNDEDKERRQVNSVPPSRRIGTIPQSRVGLGTRAIRSASLFLIRGMICNDITTQVLVLGGLRVMCRGQRSFFQSRYPMVPPGAWLPA